MGECGQVFSMELSFRYLKRQNLGKVCTKELSVHWSRKAKNFVTIEVAFADFSSFSKPLLLPKISAGSFLKLNILQGVQTPVVNFFDISDPRYVFTRHKEREQRSFIDLFSISGMTRQGHKYKKWRTFGEMCRNLTFSQRANENFPSHCTLVLSTHSPYQHIHLKEMGHKYESITILYPLQKFWNLTLVIFDMIK